MINYIYKIVRKMLLVIEIYSHDKKNIEIIVTVS